MTSERSMTEQLAFGLDDTTQKPRAARLRPRWRRRERMTQDGEKS
jgi:hypothetical protein